MSRIQYVPLGLLVVYLTLWSGLAWAPVDRPTWLLENILVFIAVPIIVFAHWRRPFSAVTSVLLFLFFCLHAVGSHFTYSLVPYDAWMEALAGVRVSDVFGWERNHYDRLVHFGFGALLVYPLREVLRRWLAMPAAWSYAIPVALIMALSCLYELIEWGAAVVFGGDLGMSFLGTQGDVWDGHWDMGLATLGALLAMLWTTFVRALRRCELQADQYLALELR